MADRALARERLPADAILTNGAGNYATWVHRFYRYGACARSSHPTRGAMGYGVPSAVAAKSSHPERTVVSVERRRLLPDERAGAGHGRPVRAAAIVVIVIDNGMYGTIRMHQERNYPGRVIGTELVNPDFAALARAYGAHRRTVERTEEFAPAFERALAAGKPALIEIRLDPEAITPRQSLSEIRKAALPR